MALIIGLVPVIARLLSWVAAFLIVDRIVGLGEAVVEDETPTKAGLGLGLGFALPLFAVAAIVFALQRVRIGRVQ